MTILIAGCGYLGRAVAGRLREAGHRVIGLTFSTASADGLRAAGFEAVAGDIGDDAVVRSLPPVDAVVQCAASGRGGTVDQFRRINVDGCRNFLGAQPRARHVFTSSTSVYPQTDGSWVTEDSAADAPGERARVLREAEDAVLAANGCVLRLAGLYGPGRCVVLERFLLGQARIEVRAGAPATPDGRWINQVHRDDAAATIVLALEHPLSGIFNAADRTPMTQRTLYAELARRFDRPLPAEGPPDLDRRRGWTHKRVSSHKLAATGWSPRFPSWFDALDHDPDLVHSVLARVRSPTPNRDG